MLKEHDIVFTGGMNSDDDDKNMPRGDYRDLVNLRAGLTSDNNQGMAESIRSVLPSNINWRGTSVTNAIMVGSGIDMGNDLAYLFYQDLTNGYSQIVEYSISAGIGSGISIFEDRNNKLNFNINYPIFNARVLNGNVYWTDNNSQPMFVNIAKAKEHMTRGYHSVSAAANWDPTETYNAGDHVLYSSNVYKCISGPTQTVPTNITYWTIGALISEVYIPGWDLDSILFIATPPVDAPQLVYQTDSSLLTNNLRTHLYQFAYRWIYFDYRKSVFGPASLVPIPEAEESLTGEANSDISTNNKLFITLNTGTPSVVSIELIFRSSKDWSTWYRLGIYEKFNSDGTLEISSNDVLNINFYDDVAPLAVSDGEVYKPYHYVPQKAGFLEIIEGNNMVFANCLEGYPSITPDVTLEKSLIDLSALVGRINMNSSSEKEPWDPWEAALTLVLPYQHYPGSRYNIHTYDYENGDLDCYYDLAPDADPEDYPLNVKNGLIAAAQAVYMEWIACGPWCTNCNDYTLCFYPIYWDPVGQSAKSIWASMGAVINGWIDDPGGFLNKIPNMKEGASHGVGITYYDEERRAAAVIVDDGMRFYLDYYQDNSGSGLLINTKRWTAELTINHLPPVWASYFQIVYTGNLSMSYWIQAKIFEVSTQPEYLLINIKYWIRDMKVAYSNFVMGDYEHQAGDRMRIVGYFSGTTFMEWTHPFVDVEVIGDDNAAPQKIRVQRFENDSELDDNYVIEIYRPKKTYSDDIFYEIADLKFDIKTTGNGRVHGGNTDQVLDGAGKNLTGAIISLDNLQDSYKYPRNNGGGAPWYASSQHISDYYRPSNFSSLGFPKVEDDHLAQRQMTNRLRYGGILALNTQNNQIADFNYDGYEDVPEKHGAINGLQEVGFVLKILQAHRVWSIYIRRTSSFNPDGTEQILLTDRIMGTKRPDSQQWGTQNPESVIVHERYMYFWDASQGRMIRDAANGLQDISDYKMKSFFRAAQGTIVEVRPGINESFEEVWFQLNNGVLGVDSGYTIVFNEKKNRWTHKITHLVDRYFNIGDVLVSTNNAAGPYVMQHEAGADYNQLSIFNIDLIIEAVANPDPDAVKIFKGIIQHSSHKFWSPTVGDISIPPNDNYPLGMETRLLKEKVISQEGIYYGPIMMDNNSPIAALDTIEKRIVDGRPMRGSAIRIKLIRDDHTTERIVYEGVKITYINSKRT